MIRKAVNHIGKVLEVKVDSKEGSALRAGRARMELNLQEPLKTGKLIRINGKTLWLDFRYERLSHFWYSCGRLGHYATYCKDYPFEEAKIDGKDKMAYGQWLRAEVQEYSPYWQTFYNPPSTTEDLQETVPKTPPTLLPIVPFKPPLVDGNANPMSRPRNLHLPSEPENQRHFHQNAMKQGTSLSSDLIPGLETIAKVLWQIWCMRNSYIFRRQ